MTKYNLHINLETSQYRYKVYTLEVLQNEALDSYFLVNLTSLNMVQHNHVDTANIIVQNKAVVFDYKDLNKVIAQMALKYDKSLEQSSNQDLKTKLLDIIKNHNGNIEEF